MSHVKKCYCLSAQSLSKHTHWEILIIVDYHHIADERGCDVSGPAFRIQHFIFIYLANFIPKVNFSGISQLLVS